MMGAHTGRVLVCYATGTGCTQGVADRIGETLTHQGFRVDVEPFDSKPDPTGYDAVIAGSGTRAGSWHPVAKRWMKRHAIVLRTMPLAMFTVGIALAHGPEKTDEARGVTRRLLESTKLEPLDIGVFAGWYEPRKFTAIERRIMRIAKSPEGDFRDWSAIEGWATRIATRLVSPERVAVA